MEMNMRIVKGRRRAPVEIEKKMKVRIGSGTLDLKGLVKW